MYAVKEFINSFEGHQKEVLLLIHNYMMAQPQITAKIRYKIPFYYRKTWICYLNPGKNGNVELGFIRGTELSNIQGLLDAKDRKMITSMTLRKVKEIPTKKLFEIIQEAIILDEKVPFRIKKKRK